MPGSAVTPSAAICSAMRHRFLDGIANRPQVVRKMTCIQTGLESDHAATDVDTNSSGNDGAFRWNDASDRSSDPPMHVGHRSDPAKHERHLSHIEQLDSSFVVERDSARPGSNAYALFRCKNIVRILCHFAVLFGLRRFDMVRV